MITLRGSTNGGVTVGKRLFPFIRRYCCLDFHASEPSALKSNIRAIASHLDVAVKPDGKKIDSNCLHVMHACVAK